jgi:sugar lactone lactonase YvrE
MKTIGKILVLPAIFALTLSGGCSDDEHKDVTPAEMQAPAVTLFTPTSGGKSTRLSLYGANFGTDVATIRVTVNGTDADVTGSTGNIITATVRKGSGSGTVSVIIGAAPDVREFTYKYPFVYSTEPVVSTFLGETTPSPSSSGAKDDGDDEAARFSKPGWLAWKGDALYIIEEKTDPDIPATIRVARNGTVSTVLSKATSPLTIDRPRALAFAPDGSAMYLANDKNDAGPIAFGKMTWNNTEFENPVNIWDTETITVLAVHPLSGAVFFIGYGDNSWIYKYDPLTATVTEKAKLTQTDGGTVVAKANASCLVFDPNSHTFYVTTKKHVIFKGEYDPDTDTFSGIHICAGKLDTPAFADATTPTDARFNEPWQADFDKDGNLYIADRKNHCIRCMTPSGVVSTYAGTGVNGTTDGVLSNAQFNHPQGLTFGPDGVLYIADYWNHRIRKIESE